MGFTKEELASIIAENQSIKEKNNSEKNPNYSPEVKEAINQALIEDNLKQLNRTSDLMLQPQYAFQNEAVANSIRKNKIKARDENDIDSKYTELDDANIAQKTLGFDTYGKLLKITNSETGDIENALIATYDDDGTPILKKTGVSEKELKKLNNSVISAYGSKPFSENFITSFSKGLYNSVSSLGNELINFGELSKDLINPDQETNIDKAAEQSRIKNKLNTLPSSYIADRGMFDNSQGFASALGQGAGTIAEFAALGLAGGAAGSALAGAGILTAEGAAMFATISNFGASAVLNTGEAWSMGKEAGLSDADNSKLALITGAINSALELGFGTNQMIDFVTKNKAVIPSIAKEVLESTQKGIVKEGLNAAKEKGIAKAAEVVKNFINTKASSKVGRIAQSAFEEGAEEAMQGMVLNTGQVVYDNFVNPNAKEGEGKFGTKIDENTFKQLFEEAAIGTILGSVGGAFSKQEEVDNITPMIMKGQGDRIKNHLKDLLNSKKISEENYNIGIARVEKIEELKTIAEKGGVFNGINDSKFADKGKEILKAQALKAINDEHDAYQEVENLKKQLKESQELEEIYKESTTPSIYEKQKAITESLQNKIDIKLEEAKAKTDLVKNFDLLSKNYNSPSNEQPKESTIDEKLEEEKIKAQKLADELKKQSGQSVTKTSNQNTPPGFEPVIEGEEEYNQEKQQSNNLEKAKNEKVKASFIILDGIKKQINQELKVLGNKKESFFETAEYISDPKKPSEKLIGRFKVLKNNTVSFKSIDGKTSITFTPEVFAEKVNMTGYITDTELKRINETKQQEKEKEQGQEKNENINKSSSSIYTQNTDFNKALKTDKSLKEINKDELAILKLEEEETSVEDKSYNEIEYNNKLNYKEYFEKNNIKSGTIFIKAGDDLVTIDYREDGNFDNDNNNNLNLQKNDEKPKQKNKFRVYLNNEFNKTLTDRFNTPLTEGLDNTTPVIFFNKNIIDNVKIYLKINDDVSTKSQEEIDEEFDEITPENFQEKWEKLIEEDRSEKKPDSRNETYDGFITTGIDVRDPQLIKKSSKELLEKQKGIVYTFSFLNNNDNIKQIESGEIKFRIYKINKNKNLDKANDVDYFIKNEKEEGLVAVAYKENDMITIDGYPISLMIAKKNINTLKQRKSLYENAFKQLETVEYLNVTGLEILEGKYAKDPINYRPLSQVLDKETVFSTLEIYTEEEKEFTQNNNLRNRILGAAYIFYDGVFSLVNTKKLKEYDNLTYNGKNLIDTLINLIKENKDLISISDYVYIGKDLRKAVYVYDKNERIINPDDNKIKKALLDSYLKISDKKLKEKDKNYQNFIYDKLFSHYIPLSDEYKLGKENFKSPLIYGRGVEIKSFEENPITIKDNNESLDIVMINDKSFKNIEKSNISKNQNIELQKDIDEDLNSSKNKNDKNNDDLYSINGESSKITNEIFDLFNQDLSTTIFNNNLTPSVIYYENEQSIEDSEDEQFIDKVYNGSKKITLKRLEELENDDSDDAKYKKKVLNFLLDNFDKAVLQHKKYLNSLKVSTLDTSIDNEDVANEINKSKDNSFKEGNIIDPKSTMFRDVKFLIATLPETIRNEEGELFYLQNDLGTMPKVNFESMYAEMIEELNNISDFDKMIDKLRELAERNSNYEILLERMGYVKSNTGKYYFEEKRKLKNREFRNLRNLHTQFFQDFFKPISTSITTYINTSENGKSIDVTSSVSNRNKAEERLIFEFDESFKNSELLDLDDEGEPYLSEEILEKLENQNKQNKSKNWVVDSILQLIKIDSKIIEENYEKLTKPISRLSAQITKTLKEKGKIYSLIEHKNIKDSLRELSNTIAQYKKVDKSSDFSYYNAIGNIVYSPELPNYTSLVVSDINTANNINELLEKHPQLFTDYVKNSRFLNEIFDKETGKKKYFKGQPVSILLNLNTGLKEQNDAVEFTDSQTSDYLLSQFYNWKNRGTISFTRASDKSTDRSFSISSIENTFVKNYLIPIDTLGINDNFVSYKMVEIFFDYLKDEINYYNNTLKDLSKTINVYKLNEIGIISSLFTENELASFDYTKDYNEQSDSIKRLIYEKLNNHFSKEYYEFNKILGKNIVEKLNIGKTLNQEFSIEYYIKGFLVNSLAHNIEYSKLFLGHPAFYKDLFKRTSGPVAPKNLARNDNTYLNELTEDSDIRIIDKNRNIIKTFSSFDYETDEKMFKDVSDYVRKNKIDVNKNVIFGKGVGSTKNQTFKTQVVADVKKDSYSKDLLDKDYKEMDEADAQAFCTFDFYREFLNRIGKWNPYQERLYRKIKLGIPLSIKDFRTYFPPLKPQYFGFAITNDITHPLFNKYSIYPAIKGINAKGNNLEKAIDLMEQNGIGYVVFDSGQKVGGLKNPPSLYKSNDSSRELNENFISNPQELYWHNLGNQVEIAPVQKSKVTFGTQFRKLLSSNLFIKGELKNNKLKNTISKYENSIKNWVELEKNILIKELGVKLNTDGTVIWNDVAIEKLNKLMIENIESNEGNINSIIALKNNTNYDLIAERHKLEYALTSIAESRLVKQKMNGDALIQTASTLFEKEKDVKFSNDLRFYEKTKNGISKAETKVTLTKDYFYLLDKFGNERDTFDKKFELLNKELQKLREGKSDKFSDDEIMHLSLIGYRIPTQGHNSMESLQIVEFLHPLTMNQIILPTEIVKKSGGDYDVDKLNIFRYNGKVKNGNFVIDKNKSDNELKEDYKKLVEGLYENYKKDKLKSLNIKRNTPEYEIAIESGLIEPNDENFIENFKIITEEDFINNYKKKVYQNEIIESAQTIFSDLSVFDYLLEPNSVEVLKEEVKNLEKLINIPSEQKGFLNQLSIKNLIDTYQFFLGGKKGVGIAALQSTFHSTAQKLGLKLQPETLSKNIFNYDLKEMQQLGKEKDLSGKYLISDLISQFVNAYVDIAKDPFIFRLNAGTDNASKWLYLIQLGIPIREIAYFMNLPLIRNWNIKDRSQKSIFSKSLGNKKIKINDYLSGYDKNMIDDFIKKGITKKQLEEIYLSLPNRFTEEQLKNALTNNPKNINEAILNYKINRKALLFLKQLDKETFELSEVMQSMNSDTSRIKTLQEHVAKTMTQMNLINESYNSDVNEQSLGSIIENYGEFYNNSIQSYFNNSFFTYNLFRPLFITYNLPSFVEESQKFINDLISNRILKRNKKDREIRTMHNDFVNFIIQNLGDRIGASFNIIFKGDDTVADKFLELKEKYPNYFESNLFLNNLQLKKIKGYKYLHIKNKNLDPFTILGIRNAFKELETIKNKEFKTLIDDLVKLAILQRGGETNNFNFLHLIPNEKYEEYAKKAFVEFEKLTDDSKNKAINIFIDNYSKHRSNNNKYSRLYYVKRNNNNVQVNQIEKQNAESFLFNLEKEKEEENDYSDYEIVSEKNDLSNNVNELPDHLTAKNLESFEINPKSKTNTNQFTLDTTDDLFTDTIKINNVQLNNINKNLKLANLPIITMEEFNNFDEETKQNTIQCYGK